MPALPKRHPLISRWVIPARHAACSTDQQHRALVQCTKCQDAQHKNECMLRCSSAESLSTCFPARYSRLPPGKPTSCRSFSVFPFPFAPPGRGGRCAGVHLPHHSRRSARLPPLLPPPLLTPAPMAGLWGVGQAGGRQGAVHR